MNQRMLGNGQRVSEIGLGCMGMDHAYGKPVNQLDSSPASIRTQLEGSLRRLRTEYIDLYYQHRVDPNIDPENVAETMNALIQR